MPKTRPILEPETQRDWKWKNGKRYFKKIIFKKERKKESLAIWVSDKIHFISKQATRDKTGHYVLIKDSIQLEYITIIKHLCT